MISMTCPAHTLAATRSVNCDDVDLIQHFIEKIPESGVVVDLGVGSGTTAMAVLCRRADLQIYSVDKNPAMFRRATKYLEDAKVPLDNWRKIELDSVQAAERFLDASVSFVLLDTTHTYEGTATEIQAWLPKLTPGGLFWFHDYDAEHAPDPPRDPQFFYPGVKRAVDEAVASGQLVFQRRHGWSALTRKPK